jgi:cell division protein FtsB
MENLRSRNSIKKPERFIYSTPFLIVVGLITLSMVSGAWKMYEKAKVTEENLSKVDKVYVELQKRESGLVANVQQLQTSFGVEAEVRNKYGYVKKGEEVVVIVNEPIKNGEASTTSEIKKGFWKKVGEMF